MTGSQLDGKMQFCNLTKKITIIVKLKKNALTVIQTACKKEQKQITHH